MSERRFVSQRALMPYLAFTALGLIWGASFLFIKLGIHDMSPSVLVLVRSASGAIALGAVMVVTGRRLVGPDWKNRIWLFVFMAIVNALFPWAAIAWGEQHISSGLASVLNSTTVLWAAILIYFVLPAERPSALNYFGVVVGLAGVVVLVLPDLIAHGISGSFLGVLAVVAAAMSYAVSALVQRLRMRGVDVFELSFGQLAATALLAIPLAAPTIPSVHLALLSMGAVIALGVGGSAVAYLLYFYTMNTLGAVRATGVTFVVPVTAVFWGVVLLRESITLSAAIGMLVIMAGVVLTNMRRRAARPAAVERDSAVA